jgi:chemotaxis response regulator CheB
MVNQHDQSKPIRIGVADKSPLMRAALKQLFSEDDRFLMVSASENSEDFLKAAEPFQIDVFSV